MNKFAYYVSMFVLFCAIAFGVLIIFWMVYPYKPVVFNDKEFPIINTTVKQGQLVTYKSNYCKYMDLPATVTRTFQNDILYVTPQTTTNRPLGCNVIFISVLVPNELPPGMYQLQQHYTFQVNPIRTVDIIEYTEEFEVKEATPSGTR